MGGYLSVTTRCIPLAGHTCLCPRCKASVSAAELLGFPVGVRFEYQNVLYSFGHGSLRSASALLSGIIETIALCPMMHQVSFIYLRAGHSISSCLWSWYQPILRWRASASHHPTSPSRLTWDKKHGTGVCVWR